MGPVERIRGRIGSPHHGSHDRHAVRPGLDARRRVAGFDAAEAVDGDLGLLAHARETLGPHGRAVPRLAGGEVDRGHEEVVDAVGLGRRQVVGAVARPPEDGGAVGGHPIVGAQVHAHRTEARRPAAVGGDQQGDPVRVGHRRDGVVEASYWITGLVPEWDRKWTERYKIPPRIHGSLSAITLRWAVVPALEIALKKHGKADRQTIRAALEEIDVKDSPLGPIKFDANHQAWINMILIEMNDGQLRILEKLPTSPALLN